MALLNVAICEDEDMELKRLEKILGQTSFTINKYIFNNASDLVKNFEPGKYDLILMDIYMPGMTGVQAVEKIRKKD